MAILIKNLYRNLNTSNPWEHKTEIIQVVPAAEFSLGTTNGTSTGSIIAATRVAKLTVNAWDSDGGYNTLYGTNTVQGFDSSTNTWVTIKSWSNHQLTKSSDVEVVLTEEQQQIVFTGFRMTVNGRSDLRSSINSVKLTDYYQYR